MEACRRAKSELGRAQRWICISTRVVLGRMSPAGTQDAPAYNAVKDEEGDIGAIGRHGFDSATRMSRVGSTSVKWAQQAAKQRSSTWGYVAASIFLLWIMVLSFSRRDPWDVSDRLTLAQGGPRVSQWDLRARPTVYKPRDVRAGTNVSILTTPLIKLSLLQLLSKYAPSPTYLDSLRPDLRYLTCDSWSGLTGQFLTVLSLLHLAQLTQRVAVM